MNKTITKPTVGQGATLSYGSDCYAYEIISVSNDGLKCTIRAMTTKFIGRGYGDERYEYISDPENNTIDLEYNKRKKCWGQVYHRIQFFKALVNRLEKKHGWLEWRNHLPNGVKFEDLFPPDYHNPDYSDLYLVEGITKKYKIFDRVNVSFGCMRQYRDPSF